MKTIFQMKSLAITLGLVSATFLTGTAAAAAAAAVQSVEAGIPEYTKTSGVSGNLSSVGSDTLANVMTLWAE